MERRQQNGDDAYAGSYRYARARSPGRKQFAQQHAPPEYSPSGLHEGAEKDAWAPDKKTRFESKIPTGVDTVRWISRRSKSSCTSWNSTGQALRIIPKHGFGKPPLP